jgi:hypothetical protein
MLTAKEKRERLEMAIALLNDADAMIQAALGASDECYELHNAIEEVIDEVTDKLAETESA